MSKQTLSYRDKKLTVWLSVSVAIIILGILFLLNAMQDTTLPADEQWGFFPAFVAINNVLAKYIVVIAIMSCGIMLFSNVALRYEDDKLRKGLTVGITVFAFVLTLPLVYVFIAILPYHASGAMGPVGEVMGVNRIDAGFVAWFGNGAFIWIVYVFMLLLSIVFLFEPLAAGICVTHGKILLLFSKDENKKFHLFRAAELPVLKARRENEVYERAA